MRNLALLAALAAIEVACNDGSEEETRYNMKLGFIPGTKDDVATGHMTLDEGRRRCTAEPKCTAITYHGRPDASGQVFVYLKADTSVAEADKTWTSYIKVCPHASTAPEIIKRHTPLSSHAHAHRRLVAAPVPPKAAKRAALALTSSIPHSCPSRCRRASWTFPSPTRSSSRSSCAGST